MIIHDGKKAATMILSKMKDGSPLEAPVSSSYDSEGGDDLKAIAEDMFMAFEKKDPALLATALQAFVTCIKEEDEEQDSGE